jgi:hypothetical protein
VEIFWRESKFCGNISVTRCENKFLRKYFGGKINFAEIFWRENNFLQKYFGGKINFA